MLRTYRSIVLPISIPSFVVVLIWQFASAWNDFLLASAPTLVVYLVLGRYFIGGLMSGSVKG